MSKIVSFKVFARDETAIPTLILSLLASAAVGFVASASGTIGLADLLHGHQHLIDIGVLSALSPIVSIAGGGGAGGIGSGGGFFGLWFFWILMVVIAFTIQGTIVGATSGMTVGILFGAIRGSVRTGVVASVATLVSLDTPSQAKSVIIWKSAKAGFIEGAIVGGIVGLIQGLVTVIAFQPRG